MGYDASMSLLNGDAFFDDYHNRQHERRKAVARYHVTDWTGDENAAFQINVVVPVTNCEGCGARGQFKCEYCGRLR